MAIPEKPYTRKEMYLNAIAGGNGGIPSTPYTREEMYLDAIAKAGGGGSGDNHFVITLSLDSDKNYTVDKTYAEIRAAIENGQFPIVVYPTTDATDVYYPSRTPNGESKLPVLFNTIYLTPNGGVGVTCVGVTENDNVISTDVSIGPTV